MEYQHVLCLAIIVVPGLVAPGIVILRSVKIRTALWRYGARLVRCLRFPLLGRIQEAAEIRDMFDDVCQQYELTSREQDVVRLIAQGRSNQQIADDLSVTVSTVKKHITKVYYKCGISGRDELLSLLEQTRQHPPAS